jgi:hypothetical protein
MSRSKSIQDPFPSLPSPDCSPQAPEASEKFCQYKDTSYQEGFSIILAKCKINMDRSCLKFRKESTAILFICSKAAKFDLQILL